MTGGLNLYARRFDPVVRKTLYVVTLDSDMFCSRRTSECSTSWGVHSSNMSLHTGQRSHYPPGNHTMLATSKNVLFPGPSPLVSTGADDPLL